jgi:hypothetical protein
MTTPLDVAAGIAALPDTTLGGDVGVHSSALLAAGEASLESWLFAQEHVPTQGRVEGFRLLALHRQAARDDPRFNACRESCRELIYQCNMALAAAGGTEAARHLRLAAAVATHLALFVAGKLENAHLGEFCCSSRGLRQDRSGAMDDAMQGAK